MIERRDIDEQGRLVRAEKDMNYLESERHPRVSVEEYLDAYQRVTLAGAFKQFMLWTCAILVVAFIVAAIAGWRP